MTNPPYDGRRPLVLLAVFVGTVLLQLGGLALGWWPTTLLTGLIAGVLVRGLLTGAVLTLATGGAWAFLLWWQSGGRTGAVADLLAAVISGSPDGGGWLVLVGTYLYAAVSVLAGWWLGAVARRVWPVIANLRAGRPAFGSATDDESAPNLASRPQVLVFNRIADSYDARFGAECARMHTLVLDWAATGPAPAVVLDVGCGTGMLLAEAANRWPGAQLIGVDPAERMLDRARVTVPGADLRVGVAEDLPVQASTVDVVLTTTSFGQWPDQLAGLREIRRVLRPDGRVYLAEHNKAPWFMRLVFRVPAFRDPDQTRALMAEAGLRVRRLEVVDGNVVATMAEPVEPETAEVAAVEAMPARDAAASM